MCLQMTSFVQPAVQNPTTLHELHNNNCLIDLSLQLSFLYVLLFDFPNILKKKFSFLTFNLPPLSSSLIFSRASTVLFRSLCSRLPKSLNMVEPPESTMF